MFLLIYSIIKSVIYVLHPNNYLIENAPVVIKEITREIVRPKNVCEIIYQDIVEPEFNEIKDVVKSIQPVVLPHNVSSKRNIKRMFK